SSPVESVSSIMDTTWAVISWSVPSYIPSDHPIITYEIGYHMLQSGNCSVVNDVDAYYINTLALNQNVSCGSTFTIITGLYSDTCYIFGLRPYTDNGYGAWTFITSETLTLQSPTMSIHSKTIMFIIYVTVYFKLNYGYSAFKTDEDIAMQVCTPYDLHKTEVPSKENERAYEECEAPPDAATDDSIYDL
uniref:Fibronectin type-III domain-containing protein n=1 Tax=Amphimedon queenslandica TaxID=400682 RepID=A0A1X7SSZ3_AMPQE